MAKVETELRKASAKMPVMEVFGPTIQGEGSVIGRKTMFVRTGGCDYACSWCDSKFTWDGSEKATMMTAAEVWQQLTELATVPAGENPEASDVVRYNFDHVTISGGNPALIGEAMKDFVDLCYANQVQVGLETQGTKWQEWMYDIADLTISPKPPSSGMVTDWEKLDYIINKLEDMWVQNFKSDHKNHSLKVVIFDDADYEFAKKVHKRYPAVPMFVSVGNSDTKTDDLYAVIDSVLVGLKELFERIIADPDMNNVRPLPQLHTLVWGNLRAV